MLWTGLLYALFFALTVRGDKPRLEEGMNGTWMLIVVATQSVSVLGTLLAPWLGRWADPVLAFTTRMFLSLILYRFLFFDFDPQRLTPPYWIAIGAVAITTLSGALLVLAAEQSPLTREIRPFLKGFTLLFWATATWWVPLLLLLGVWRHVARRVRIRYDSQYWSMVFPLGMYTVATVRLDEALGWPFLAPLYYTMGAVALGAWSAVFVGLLRSLALRGSRSKA